MAVILTVAAALMAGAFARAQSTPEQRAIDYLAVEAPRWFRENQCMSCHNNGDAARALYTGLKLGYRVPGESLAGTTRWLSEPGGWNENRGNPIFSDKKLAGIQFSASLVAAYEAGLVRDRGVLARARELLLPYQEADGSWQVGTEMEAGSPATYGPVLATYMARRTLEAAGGATEAVASANRWLLANRPRSLLDAAAMLLALPDNERIKRKTLDPILRAQTDSGGWGPQRFAPAEAFDTAVVLLALRNQNQPEAIARGRAFLIATQLPSGGWPETTRPPGARSYAQHISTSGWAALALVTTNPKW